MRVVILSESYTEQMGYSDTLLGKTLAALGVTVDIITSDQYLADYRGFRSLYKEFLGEQKPVETRVAFGCTIHTLPSAPGLGKEGVRLRGIQDLLAKLKPDVLQALKLNSQCTWQAYGARPKVGFRFFLEEHNHWSVFGQHPAWKRQAYKLFYGQGIGRWLSRHLERDYCLGEDCRTIAVDYYGVPATKAVVTTQGTDTDIFRPAETEAEHRKAQEIRQQMGAAPDDFVCIYTGRLNPDKQPLLLAQAVAQLRREGLPIRALFVGWGHDAYRQQIEALEGSYIHPFVKWYELADFYRAADVGVWPDQESMSQLDALATGLPLVLHSGVGTPDRVAGTGRLFQSGSADDLARVLREMLDPSVRGPLGQAARAKAIRDYSWRCLAQQRIADYEAALRTPFRA